MRNIFAALSAPFDPAEISWRIGSTTKDKTRGMALAYVSAREVQDRFDEVLTPFGWQCRHEMGNDKRITCHIGVRDGADGEWIWKSDGAGETDFEGEKGSYSDSFKRAAVKWGVGRYLYDLSAPWVELDGNRIKESELPKLNALLENHMSIAKLVLTAGEKSNEGIEIYKTYYLGLSVEQRKALEPYHDQFKQNAQTVSNNPKQKAA